LKGRGISRKVSHIVEIAALRVVSAILHVLGIDVSSALMGFLWRHFGPFNHRHERCDAHLRLALPELTAEERRRLLGSMWENLGRTAAETLLIDDFVKQQGRIAITPVLAAAVEQAESFGRGIVFCSLHTGNWELVASGPKQFGQPLAAVYKRLANPYSDAFLRRLRLMIYDGGLMEAGSGSALKLRSMAREGLGIAMLSDLPDHTGIRLPFFGHDSTLASMPIAMARRLGIPVIVGRCIRASGAHFVIDGHILAVPKTGDAEADILAGTRLMHATFEDWIREKPEQWMWSIRKWGHLPETAAAPAGVETESPKG
jgi:KDO2-lipid IV(A) lauroyltransferase